MRYDYTSIGVKSLRNGYGNRHQGCVERGAPHFAARVGDPAPALQNAQLLPVWVDAHSSGNPATSLPGICPQEGTLTITQNSSRIFIAIFGNKLRLT